MGKSVDKSVIYHPWLYWPLHVYIRLMSWELKIHSLYLKQAEARWKKRSGDGHNENCSPWCEGDHPPAPEGEPT